MTTPVSVDPLARLAERQSWITSAAEIAAQNAVKNAFKALGPNPGAIRSALHGDWLHEPLHAIMTDIPVGSWTAAVLFDAIASLAKSDKMDHAADALVILGLIGAAGASVTGMNDWAEIRHAAPRKIGAVHAMLNIAATGFFGASFFARRKRGSRSSARALAAIGFILVSASAHLGGNLVYEHGIGVGRGKSWAE